MRILFDAFFGFVCHPFVMLTAVLTQLAWSLWMYEADIGTLPVLLHCGIGVAALAALVMMLRFQCRRRAHVKYHPSWTLLGERVFEGQLALGMSYARQCLCGLSLGVLISLIDESEVLARLFLSPALLDELRDELGPRGGVPHLAHAHDTMLILFIAHGWVWTLVTAWLLGRWSNAAKLHSAETKFLVD
jgi:hypothetical protein